MRQRPPITPDAHTLICMAICCKNACRVLLAVRVADICR